MLKRAFVPSVLSVLSVAFLSGCLTSPPAPEAPARTNILRRAVVAGLTAVDPAAYNGWSGACPGADVDAEIFADLCRQEGLAVSFHKNAQATRERLFAAVRGAWVDMSAGDLLVVFISGHGGQVPDTNGDEEDAHDETLCLWDGELLDDALAALLSEAPAGLRIFYVTDTCNSGTNYRRRRNWARAIPRQFAGALIHYGGCADGKTASGSAQGGTFTTALVDAWARGISYRDWFTAAAGMMPDRTQVPAYAEFGAVTQEFRNAKVFE